MAYKPELHAETDKLIESRRAKQRRLHERELRIQADDRLGIDCFWPRIIRQAVVKKGTIMRSTCGLVLLAGCSVMLGCSVKNPKLLSVNAANRPPDVTLTMSARKFGFDPSEIRVKEGQVAELRMAAADRKPGFGLEAFGIRAELA